MPLRIPITRLHPRAQYPLYQTSGSAAMDLLALIDEPVILSPLERRLIPTGIAIALPHGYEAQVRARSGMALKHGIGLVNGIGTIDADYRGEIGVIAINYSDEPFTIAPDMRIAQLVIARYETVEWEGVDVLEQTNRGSGGYGSTGNS